MCDHQEKDHMRRKSDGKSQQMKPNHSHRHQYQHKRHQSDDNDSQDSHSTAEDSVCSNHHSDHRRHSNADKPHDSHSQHYHRKQNHRHVSRSATSSTGSSSSTSSSSSSSSTSSSSSSSSYSSSSTSSSNLSSDNSSSSEDLDGHPLGKAQHSQSCTDISRKHKYFEDRDDTTPLIDKRGSSYKLPSKQKREKGKSSKTGPTHGTLKNTHRITKTNDGSFRKAKSMEALSSARERDGFEHEDEQEQEKRKNDAKKNLMKEKMKFSAFLNEITRQVLSPMRLTTLGVTDAQRPSSAGQARVGSGTAERHRQQRSRPASADSVASSRHSQSSQLSNSKSIQRHHSRRSSGSSDHIYSKPKSCTDISCLKRRNSWSQNPPPSHSPSYAHHHRDQEDHHSHDHHYDHGDCSSPSSHHHHSDHHNTSHHHHHHRHHQNPAHHHDHNSPSYRHHDHSDASHHHHYGDHHGDRHSPARHHREHLSSAHHHHHHHHHGDHHGHANHHQHSEPHGDVPHHGDAHITSHNHHHHHHHREHHSPTHHHQEHHHSGDEISGHHHSNHPNTEHPTTPHHHDHHSPRHHHHHRDHHGLAVHKSGHQHHHGDHHSETHHHHHGEHSSPSHHHHHEDHHSRSHPHHHKDHPSEPHQQDLEDHHSPGHYRHHVDHHGEAHQHHHVDHHSESHHHHHGDHRNEGHSHHHGDHHNEGHHHHHGEHRSESHQHHHVDHHSEGHHHEHGDHQNDSHSHHHGDHHIDSHQHHHTDHHSEGHHHHHGDHHKEPHEHHHGDHHSEVHQHHHGDHHSESHQHHHGDHRKEAHHHHHGDHNREAQHHHGEYSSPIHSHHHGDHHNESHQHHRGHHHSPDHQHHHGNHHNETHCHSAAVQQHHNDHQHSGHLHHQEEHHHESHHHHHHGEHHNTSQKHIHNDTGHHPESYFNQPHFKTNDVDHDDHHAHLKRHSDISPPSRRNISSVSSQEEEQTNFTGSSLHKEKALELGRIMVLQEQNEGMHKSLLKTAVRMECLGEEFMSSQKLLEAELQRTRVELSNLTEKFKRLHDNYSSTQQTNNLLEQKLHSVAQGMEGERERLNQRISSLTKQLADAKFADSVESFNVTSVLHKTDRHFHSDDAINQVILPITPPPAQFMDSHNYGKAKAAGQEQCLGSVPEEEESDWSEMGEETPRFILTGSNRGQAWRHREADVDKDSESGGEEMIRCHSPRPLQIPHLQFTIHNEILSVPQTGNCPSGFKNLSDGITGEGTYRITTSPNHSSAILIRSASLEEIPLARHEMQKELRGTEAMMDLHHQGDDGMEDLDNEIIHHWRTSSNVDGEGRTPEANSGLAGLQSAERMLNHFMCEATAGEGKCQGRAEQHGWTGGIPEEVLRGERTQL